MILPRVLTIPHIIREYHIINTLNAPDSLSHTISLYKKNPSININTYYNYLQQDGSYNHLPDDIVSEIDKIQARSNYRPIENFVSNLKDSETIYILATGYDPQVLEILSTHKSSFIIYLNQQPNQPAIIYEPKNIEKVICETATELIRTASYIINTLYNKIIVINHEPDTIKKIDLYLSKYNISLRYTKPLSHNNIYSLFIEIFKFLKDPQIQYILPIFKHPILFQRYYNDTLLFEKLYLQKPYIQFSNFTYNNPDNIITLFIQKTRKKNIHIVAHIAELLKYLLNEDLYQVIDPIQLQQIILHTQDTEEELIIHNIIHFFFKNCYISHKYRFTNPIDVLSPTMAYMFPHDHTLLFIHFDHTHYNTPIIKENIQNISNNNIIILNSTNTIMSNLFNEFDILDTTQEWQYKPNIPTTSPREISSFQYDSIKVPNIITSSMLELFINDPTLFYDEHILKITLPKKIPLIPSKRELGIICHKIIETTDVKNFSEQSLKCTIISILTKYLDKERFQIIHRIWQNTIYTMIFPALSLLSTRNPMKYETEQEYSFEIEGITIKARCDRIEFYADKIIIIDYKTGQIPSKKDIATLKKPQLLLQAMAVSKAYPHLPIEISYLKIEDQNPQFINLDIPEHSTSLLREIIHSYKTYYTN